MQPYIQQIVSGGRLSQEEAEAAMDQLMNGQASPEATAGFLVGLGARGETLDELVGFTRGMRAHAVPVDAGDADAIDLCGTGGDGSGTFNISTAAGFVVAGAGVTVAKHGNRSVSSACGSADVLEALGVRVDLDPAAAEDCLRTFGITFLFAPRYHPAMRFVMPVRRALGVRTFFNILGPLCNPAGVRRQLIGAYRPDVALTLVSILRALGAERVVGVHGHGGLDEFALSGPSTLFVYDRAQDGDGIREQTADPEALGLPLASADELQGGDAETNAAIIRRVLEGEGGPARDVVLLNAAYGLYASGRYDAIPDALEAAATSIDGGAARDRLGALVERSQSAPAAA